MPQDYTGIGGAAGSAIGTAIMPGAGTAIGGSFGSIIGSLFNKKPKAPHVPTGKEMGKEAMDYYNTAFPGTTPWERLGTSNPSGGVAEASIGSQTDTNINEANIRQQNKQLFLNNSMELARLALEKQRVNNETNLTNANISLTPSKQQANLYGSIPSALKSYSSDVQKIPSLLGDIVATRAKQFGVEQERRRQSLIDANVKAGFTNRQEYSPNRRINVKVNGR